jgi:hypothetical protein
VSSSVVVLLQTWCVLNNELSLSVWPHNKQVTVLRSELSRTLAATRRLQLFEPKLRRVAFLVAHFSAWWQLVLPTGVRIPDTEGTGVADRKLIL